MTVATNIEPTLKKPLHKFMSKVIISNGYSRVRLAEELGVKPSYLSQVENGHANFPDELRDEIAKIFKMNRESQQEFSDYIKRSNRARKSTSKQPTTKELVAFLEIHGDQLSEDDKNSIFQTTHKAILETKSLSIIRGRRKTPSHEGEPLTPKKFLEALVPADRFYRNHRDCTSGRVDICKALDMVCAANDRLQTKYHDTLPKEFGPVYACIEMTYAGNTIHLTDEIAINANKGHGVYRCDIAHEYGHHILHPDINRNYNLLRTKKNGKFVHIEDTIEEKQANVFAIFALMPWFELQQCRPDNILAISTNYGINPKLAKKYNRILNQPKVREWIDHLCEKRIIFERR